ncbi:uncharacterized protein LOC123547024 isoform X2 [Mercenaria mercenaria]|uniref:uncharacterized protein LOC123547024 isoform X2 n=1 Tax=Mercenaria mercenaria TaxID=6596 RepID=UPI001E1DB9EA|nr:uncharacterized protein LOC123547024 isoform X2 [Mercenaria mercenaria]
MRMPTDQGKYLKSHVHPKHVHLPDVNYYDDEIQQCQEMYSRLHLDKHPEDNEDDTTPFPLIRGHTVISQTRPLTYSLRKSAKSLRPYSIRSAPAFMFKNEQNCEKGQEEVDNDGARSESTDYDCDEHGYGRKRTRMDPDSLCEHLKQRGLGLPSLVKSASTYRRITQVPPRGMRSRSLPRNPSKREKIKGRARLDQEMANMKALAFCEQQAPKVFRTASANMKNRDVQFMEEDFRQHMQREGFDVFIEDDDDDDNASVVRMPVKQEELFVRINNWVEEVETSCKAYHPPADEPVSG